MSTKKSRKNKAKRDATKHASADAEPASLAPRNVPGFANANGNDSKTHSRELAVPEKPMNDTIHERSFNSISFPVTETGSMKFALSCAEIKQAMLMIGDVCISYAFPHHLPLGTTMPDGKILKKHERIENITGMVDLDFLGGDTMFHTQLATCDHDKRGNKVSINVEYYESAYPKLHIYSNTASDKTWKNVFDETKQHIFAQRVIVTTRDGAKKPADLVYTPGKCGLRLLAAIMPVAASAAAASTVSPTISHSEDVQIARTAAIIELPD